MLTCSFVTTGVSGFLKGCMPFEEARVRVVTKALTLEAHYFCVLVTPSPSGFTRVLTRTIIFRTTVALVWLSSHHKTCARSVTPATLAPFGAVWRPIGCARSARRLAVKGSTRRHRVPKRLIELACAAHLVLRALLQRSLAQT